jgi:hypothetical protein
MDQAGENVKSLIVVVVLGQKEEEPDISTLVSTILRHTSW